MILKLSKKINLIEQFISVYPHDLSCKSVKVDIISTYDGEYPSFHIEYETNNEISNKPLKEDEITSTIVETIKKYTNLTHGNDYWLSCEIL
jgi:hypothetical protein